MFTKESQELAKEQIAQIKQQLKDRQKPKEPVDVDAPF